MVAGLAICYYKWAYLGLPLQANQKAAAWIVQAEITFTGNGKPAIVNFPVPKIIPGFSVLDEDFISNRFGLALQEERDTRAAQWAIRRVNGQQTLYYRLFLTESAEESEWLSRPRFPERPDYQEPYAGAIQAILDDVRRESADVATYTRELLQQLNAKQPNENVELIRSGIGSDEQWVKQIIEILKGVRIPARILWGIPLTEAANDVQLTPLLQVHNGKRWLTFHPRSGVEDIPDDFLAWTVGEQPLLSLTGVKAGRVTFSVRKTYHDIIEVVRLNSEKLHSFLIDMSPLSLPVSTQNVYQLLLMLPVGALVVVFFRVYVGVKTFGTFMPILIALAFRETQLLWGLVAFTAITLTGLFIRFYLERLMLLLVPRLTSILIIVLILMLLVSVISNQLGFQRPLAVALFPMVILAMTIERMSITWEEYGGREALAHGLGSLLVAIAGYLLMSNEQLMYLMFVFPEFLLVLLGLSLWMGRYTGYRLTELRRFRPPGKE